MARQPSWLTASLARSITKAAKVKLDTGPPTLEDQAGSMIDGSATGQLPGYAEELPAELEH